MKTIFAVFIWMAFFVGSFAQDRKPKLETEKFGMIAKEKKCHSVIDYLRTCVCYPEVAKENNMEGTEVIQFDVTTKGEVKNFNVVNSISPAVDKHIIGLLEKTSGLWTPGMKNGETVTMTKKVGVIIKCGEMHEKAVLRYFAKKGKANLNRGTKLLFVKNKPKKALKYLNRGIRYLPNEDCLLLARGVCRHKLGDIAGAEGDWNRMKIAGVDEDAKEMVQMYSGLEQYPLLASLIE